MAQVLVYIISNYTWIVLGAIIILLAIIGSYADKTNFGQGKKEPAKKVEDVVLKNTGLEDYENGLNEINYNKENKNPVDVQENVQRTENLYNQNTVVNNYNEKISTENNNIHSIDLNNELDDTPLNTNHNINRVEINQVENNANTISVSDNFNDSNLNQNLIEESQNIESTNIIVGNNIDDSNYVNTDLEAIVQMPEQVIQDPEPIIQVSEPIIPQDNFKDFEEEFNTILPKKEIINNDLLEDIDNLSLDKVEECKSSSIPDLDDVELPKIKELEPEVDIWKF